MSANKTIIVISVALLLLSCATTRKAAMQISVGDTKNHVAEVMGNPHERQVKEDMEAWQYGSIVAFGICGYNVIWLKGGKVVGITSYDHYSTFGCTAGMKDINWNEFPENRI
jgi:hypothetical protein